MRGITPLKTPRTMRRPAVKRSRAAELAALLLKIVRLAPRRLERPPSSVRSSNTTGSSAACAGCCSPRLEPPAPLAIMPTLAVAAMAIAIVTAMSSLATLEKIFHTLEKLVAFGR